MNKIYKVIWSKVKHQYVVVSELAHSSGKQSRTAKRSLRSRIAALVVCGAIAAFGVYGVLPTQQAFANGAETTQSQYIAVGDANYTDADNYHRGERYDPEKTYTQNIGGHAYVYTPTNDGNFWVRQGYTIEVIHDPRFTGAGGPDKNIIINAYRGENADTDGLVQSYQNVQESMNIHTLNGEELFSTNTSMYGGAVNTPTTGVTVVNPNDPNTLNEFIINEGTTALKGTTMIDVTGEKKSSYFQPVNYDSKTGLYHFGSISSSDNIVSTENLYVIDGIVGVFTKTPGGSSINDVYTGDVYGRNNEILMTGVDSKGNYVSYWGAEIVDPNAPIGSMSMSTLQGKFDEVENNIAKIHKDDIKEIQINQSQTNQGTINLDTNGGADIPGGITITSIHGNDGQDVQLQFTNQDAAGADHSFVLDAGSKVVGKTGKDVATEGGTLTSIDINGKNYLLGGGKNYSDGAGIKFEGTDNPTISVDLAENSGLHFVTEDGKQKLTNNLTVTNYEEPTDTEANNNGGNWTITENNGDGIDRELTNTTLDKTASDNWNTAEDSLIKGDINTSTADTEYGRNYKVIDTDGNVIELKDVASASTLKDIDNNKIGDLEYNAEGDVTNNIVNNKENITEAIGKLDNAVSQGWVASVDNTNIAVKPNEDGSAGKLSFEAGDNIALTADTGNKKITIAADGVVSYDKVDGEYVASVTLGGDKYVPGSDESQTKPSGGVKLTNVAYASGDDKSEAVNVDYLEDYVDKNGGGSWNLTTNGGEGEENEAVSVGKGNTVDFSGVKEIIGEGEDAKEQSNIVVSKEFNKETNTTSVKFDLSDNLNVTNITANSMTVENTTEGEDKSVVNVKYLEDHDFYLQNGKTSLGEGISFGEGENVVDTGYKADENGNIDMIVANADGTQKHVVLTDVASKTALDGVTEDVNEGWTAKVGTDEIPVNPTEVNDKKQNTLEFTGDNKNIDVTANTTDRTIKVALKDDLDVTSVTAGKTATENGTVINGEGLSTGTVKVNGTTDDTTANTITGLSNTTWNETLAGQVAENNDLKGVAATQGQLQQAVAEAVADINTNSYKGWKVSAEGKEASSVGSGATVDFSGAKEQLPETEGNPSELHQNVHVTQTAELDAEGKPTGNTNVAFDLDDKLVLGDNNTTIINGDDNYIHLGDNIALDGNSGSIALTNSKGETAVTINKDGIVVNNSRGNNGNGADVVSYDYDGDHGYMGNKVGVNSLNEIGYNTQDVSYSHTRGRTTIGNISITRVQNPTSDANVGKEILSTAGNNLVIRAGGTVETKSDLVAEGLVQAGDVTVNAEDSGLVEGLTNTTWTDEIATAAADKKSEAAGTAATQGQLGVVASDLSDQITNSGWTASTNKGVAELEKTTDIKNGGTVDFTGDKNINVDQTEVKDDKGNVIGTDIKFGLADNVSLGDGKITLNGAPEEGDDLLNVDNKVTIAQDGTTTFGGAGNGSTTINGQTIQAGGIVLNGEVSEDGVYRGTITGLTNTTTDYDGFAKAGRAATEEQLKEASAAATTTVSAGDNIDVTPTTDTEDGHTDYKVSLQDNVSLGDGKITLNGAPEEGVLLKKATIYSMSTINSL